MVETSKAEVVVDQAAQEVEAVVEARLVAVRLDPQAECTFTVQTGTVATTTTMMRSVKR